MKKLYLVLFLVLAAFPVKAHADIWALNVWHHPKASITYFTNGTSVKVNTAAILQYTDASISQVVTKRLIPYSISATVDSTGDPDNDTTLNLQISFDQSNPTLQLTAGMFGTGLNSGYATFVEATNQSDSSLNLPTFGFSYVDPYSSYGYTVNLMASSAEGYYVKVANKLNPAMPTIKMNIIFTIMGDVTVTDTSGNSYTYPGRITVHLVAANVPHQ